MAVKLDNLLQRQWFSLTDAERQFFNVDIEVIKELFLAADFLNISSLYLYCLFIYIFIWLNIKFKNTGAQELARHIMDKEPHQIREMLCLRDVSPI